MCYFLLLLNISVHCLESFSACLLNVQTPCSDLRMLHLNISVSEVEASSMLTWFSFTGGIIPRWLYDPAEQDNGLQLQVVVVSL